MRTRLVCSFLLAILLLSLSATSSWMPTAIQGAYAADPATLAETLNTIIGNVNWTYGNSWTTNWAMILADKGDSAFDEAITADIVRGDYVDALYVARLAELNGYSSATISDATATALQQIPMCGSLPITYNAHDYGDPDVLNSGCYFVYHRFVLWGYEYAEDYGFGDKWNATQAFSDFAEAYDEKPIGSVSGEMLWCDPEEDWSRSYNSRYYDEHAQTLSVFLKFAEQGVSDAMAYADSAWSGVQAHWNTASQYYGYSGTTVVECEMGNFAQIIAEYKAQKGGTIPYWDRVIQDLNYKLLANGWSSPGWSSPGVIVHATTNPQRRLWETMGAAIALQEFFPDFTSAMKNSLANMLMGSSPAWQGLIASDLNQGGYFRGVSGEVTSNSATACAAATLFLYGIVPVTGSLDIPSSEEFCNDLRTPFVASDFRFDYENHRIRIPVNAGEITFVYGSSPVSYNFPVDGVYDIEFASDWNQITRINDQYVALSPAEPQELEATEGNASISLSWSPPLSNGGGELTNYRLYKSDVSGTEVVFRELENVTSFNDAEVGYEETYYYQVTAINSFGESEFSNEASATVSQPITTDAYDGLWHTSDFSINLNATDPSGISETLYRINGGFIMSIDINGQPLIDSESAANTLEYWSIDGVGNEEFPHVMLTQIKLDKSAPTGSIQINDGSGFTTSTSIILTLTATDSISGVNQVRFGDDGRWDAETWESLPSSKSWSLPFGDGEKTVYYQIRDKAGLSSTTLSDSVFLDTASPQGEVLINNGAAYTNLTAVNLALQSTDNGSGVGQMRFSNDNSTWSPWEQYSSSRSWGLQGDDGTKIVIVQYRDNAGLVSSFNGSIVLDLTAPLAQPGQNQTAEVGSVVYFDASKSEDNTGIVSYKWAFGDGSTGNGMTTNHTYSSPGSYSAELTIQDAAGNSAQAAVIIVIQTPVPWLLIAAIAVGVALTVGAITVLLKKH